jgi:hypothetical protein
MSSTSSSSSVGTSSAPTGAEVPVINGNNTNCEAERFLLGHSNRLSVLYALCIGLKETLDDNGTTSPLMDLNEIPFKNMKKKKDIKPSLDVLREEVRRRSCPDSSPTKPKPNGWSAKKCLDWLEANPITSADDVCFLVRRARAVKQVVTNATQKAGSTSSTQPAEQGNKWVGPLPYLRLIHCLMEDDIKGKYIHRGDPKSIQEIDARRSNVRAEDVFEMISNRWNSDSFNPTTHISNCHYDYSEEIDIGFDTTIEFARASPTKVKDKLAKMRSDLSHIIHKWERSGQGESGHIHDDDDNDDDIEDCADYEVVEGGQNSTGECAPSARRFKWGRSEGRQGAFDCRESFLGANPSYLLYFWDVLDQHNLFNTTMNRLSDEAGASSGNEVPTIVRINEGKSSRTTGIDDVSVFVQNFKDVIVEASKDATRAADRRHEENKQDKERRHQEAQQAEDNRVRMKTTAADNRVILQADLEHKGYLKRRIDSLTDEARKIRFKIFTSGDNNNKKEDEFYRMELEILEKEIGKCNSELHHQDVGTN